MMSPKEIMEKLEDLSGTRKRIGVYGGSFNPPHVAHVMCADLAIKELGLDELLIVPTGKDPKKLPENHPSSNERLHLCELAFKDLDKVSILDLEIKQEKFCYTVDLLKQIKSNNKDKEVIFLLGTDQAHNFKNWKDVKEISDYASIAIVQRKGHAKHETGINQVKRLCKHVYPIKKEVNVQQPISSTIVRHHLHMGHNALGMLDHEVHDYIIEHNFYSLG